MRWSKWRDIEEVAASRSEVFQDYGVYQIRAVRPSGRPIPLSRLVGIDRDGTLYVGRSGYRRQGTKRTIAKRIREFLREQHSGGKCYARTKRTLKRDPRFRNHRLQVRARFLPDNEIDRGEDQALQKYFARYSADVHSNAASRLRARST